jgi:hypothetical protein
LLTKEEKWGYIMGTKFKTLNREVECLKKELYKLLENEPWSKNDILIISKRLDALILKFYN